MPKYKLGSEAFHYEGTLYQKGSIVELPEEYIPSVTWEGVDDKAEAAVAKVKAEVARKKALSASGPATTDLQSFIKDAVAAEVTKQLAQVKAPASKDGGKAAPPEASKDGGKGRPSDKSPL